MNSRADEGARPTTGPTVSTTGQPEPAGASARQQLADLVRASPLPALLLDLPAARIVAASAAAGRLLTTAEESLEGHSLDDFAVDVPPTALLLLQTGAVTGFETVTPLRCLHGTSSYRLWVRAAGDRVPATSAFAVLAASSVGGIDLRGAAGTQDWLVAGSTDAELVIDRISGDVETVLQIPASEILGQPLLGVVEPAGVAGLLSALAETTQSQRRRTTRVAIREWRPGISSVRCVLLLVPLVPHASCGFAFFPEGSPGADLFDSSGAAALAHFGPGASPIEVADPIALAGRRDVFGLGRLTGRELDIVGRLVLGDRVPAIAKQLFLSQNTVRNHLSSVFGKLGVDSQQSLLDILRGQDGPPRRE